MSTLIGIVISIFVLLLFLGVWLTAEYNTRAEKLASKRLQLRISKLEKTLEKAHKRIKQLESELIDVQSLQHDLRMAQNRQASLEQQNNQLKKQRERIFGVLERLRKKAKELEFADSYLARQVNMHIDEIISPEAAGEADSAQTFGKIRNKING